MATNVHVTNARVMVEQEPESNNVRVTNARVMLEQEPISQNVRVTNARIMVEYALGNNFSLSKTLGSLTLSATVTNVATEPAPSSNTKKDNPHLQWLGMRM